MLYAIFYAIVLGLSKIFEFQQQYISIFSSVFRSFWPYVLPGLDKQNFSA